MNIYLLDTERIAKMPTVNGRMGERSVWSIVFLSELLLKF